METQLLRESEIEPTDTIIEQALGKSFAVYKEFLDAICNGAAPINVEWRYYNDGKAWLGKAIYKKKTVFWLSIWDGFFKTSFYFTEKNGCGIDELPIDKGIKAAFRNNKPIGKLIPLVVNVNQNEQIKDLLQIVNYKKG